MKNNEIQILVVEDQQDMLFLLKSELKNEGYEVTVSSTGKEAIQKISEDKPDLVLLDMYLPDQNGLEVCMKIKEKRKENFLPVILVTAADKTEQKIAGLDAGADDYVTKPFSRRELKARISTMLRLKEAQDKLGQYLKKEKELLGEMAIKNEMLSRMNAMKDMFLAVASHDLLNPLNVVQGFSQLLLESEQKLLPHQIDALNKIQSNTSFMISIIRDLLKKGARTGSIPIGLKQENISAILLDCVESYRVLARDTNVVIEKIFPESLPMVWIDPVRMKEVFNNLIANAIKFTGSNGKITVTAKSEKNDLSIEVRDSGPGIKQEDIPKVFLPFKKLKNAPGAAHDGLGLGLYIVKEIVNLHGGEIQVTSELGKGSCFKVILKIEKRQTDKEENALKERETPTKRAGTLFGEIALEKEYVDPLELLFCLNIQYKEALAGKKRLIGEILLEKKMINAQQLEEILKVLEKRNSRSGKNF